MVLVVVVVQESASTTNASLVSRIPVILRAKVVVWWCLMRWS